MHSFTCLSLLLCGSMATVAANLNRQPQPPRHIAQTHVRRPSRVFYHDGALARRSTHTLIAKGANVIMTNRGGGGARLTTFASGPPGACGTTFADSDFVVALNEAEFNAANHCYENITISYGGKSTEAQIVDMCQGCSQGGLNLTYGLFSYFAPTSVGVLYGEWSYYSGQPKSTSTVEVKLQTTTTKDKPTSASLTSTTQSNTATTMTAAQAATTIPADGPQVVNQLNMAILDMAGLMTAGH